MRALNHNIRLSIASLLALCLGSYLYSSSVHAAELKDVSKVNGAIHIDSGDSVGNVASVNGRIDLARGASAYELETVNGGIELDDDVVISQAETVNGGIRVGRDVTVRGSLQTVNGGIRTESGTVIDEQVSTVNGRIQLYATRVGADVQTSNGDIELREGSVVEGDIIVKASSSWFNRVFSFNWNPSEIMIDSTSTVRGDIHLYRKVDLRIEDGAEVGDIIEHY